MIVIRYCLLFLISVVNADSIDMTFSIYEEEKAGTFIGDLSPYSSKAKGGEYAFAEEGTAKDFRVDAESGKLETARVLDKEEICPNVITPTYESNVECKMNFFVVHLNDTFNITVTLNDIDDNPLEWVDPFQFESKDGKVKVDVKNETIYIFMHENQRPGTEILLPRAIDRDDVHLHYELLPYLPHFQLITNYAVRNREASIIMDYSLDRELKSIYEFDFIAANDKKRLRRKMVIEVVDVNDNTPYFEKKEYHGTTIENMGNGTSVITVTAKDDDSNENGSIVYSIADVPMDSSGKALLRVNSTTGEVVVNSNIDRELMSNVSFSMVAKDGGQPQKSASVPVFIEVKDVNDNRPVIKINQGGGLNDSIPVPEMSPMDTKLVEFTVSDADTDPYGQPVCMLENISRRPLCVKLKAEKRDFYTYSIVSAMVFEQGKMENCSVLLNCFDSGRLQLQLRQVVNFQMKADPNKQKELVFTSIWYTFNTSESTPVDSILGKIEAKYKGKSTTVDGLKYEIIEGHKDWISVDSPSGNVRLLRPLNYEYQSSMEMNVCAIDPRTNVKAITGITLLIIDENDNKPQIMKPSYISVPENSPLTQYLYRIRIVDKDKTANGKFQFNLTEYCVVRYDPRLDGKCHNRLYSDRLVCTSDRSKFKNFDLSSDGVITQLEGDLDREEYIQHLLKFSVSDGGSPPLVSHSQFAIYIKDEDDHRPNFIIPSEKNTVFKLNATQRIGDIITKVITNDPDCGLNAKPVYRLIFPRIGTYPALKDYFIINDAGQIILNSDLNTIQSTLRNRQTIVLKIRAYSRVHHSHLFTDIPIIVTLPNASSDEEKSISEEKNNDKTTDYVPLAKESEFKIKPGKSFEYFFIPQIIVLALFLLLTLVVILLILIVIVKLFKPQKTMIVYRIPGEQRTLL